MRFDEISIFKIFKLSSSIFIQIASETSSRRWGILQKPFESGEKGDKEGTNPAREWELLKKW